jgi:hypothetical protein
MFKKIHAKLKAFDSKRLVARSAMLLGSSSIVVGAASAEVINTTAITGMLSDVGVIFPSFGNLVIALVPTLMILSVIGFVFKFFDKILAMFDRLV